MDTRIPLEIMPNSGVTAGSYGPSADATPGYGASFSVPYVTVDAKGRATGASTKTITLPESMVHYGTCSEASNVAAKTVSASGYSLDTGSRILVKFTNTNTASNPTLNVNSTGAKSIYVNGSSVEPYRIQGGMIYEFCFNGTQYDLIDGKTSAKYTSTDPGSSTTVPSDLNDGGILIYSV